MMVQKVRENLFIVRITLRVRGRFRAILLKPMVSPLTALFKAQTSPLQWTTLPLKRSETTVRVASLGAQHQQYATGQPRQIRFGPENGRILAMDTRALLSSSAQR